VRRLADRDLRRHFDALQQADGTLAARLAIASFEEELARLLLRHAAGVKQCKAKAGRSMVLARRFLLDDDAMDCVLALPAGSARRGATPLTVFSGTVTHLSVEGCDRGWSEATPDVVTDHSQLLRNRPFKDTNLLRLPSSETR
jgi:hypothetical protein